MLIGRKLGMTQVFGEDGRATAVTVLQAGPCVVVYKRAAEKNGGHAAVQIGFEPVKAGRVAKAQAGHAAKAGLAQPFRVLRDMRVEPGKEYTVGQELTVAEFAPGQKVDVIGVSKGKGFQGVIRRHHHHGGAATHGSMFHRAPGGIGASSFPSRTLKRRGLPGHMGHVRVTAQNLKVVAVYPEEHVMLVEGAVPGANKGLVMIQPAVKAKRTQAKKK